MLPAFLRERAAEFYEEVPDGIDFDELKATLVNHFSPTNARRLYYADLYERKQGDTESTADFGQDVQQLVRRAYSGMPEEHKDTQVRAHFINGLRPQLKRIVLIADPQMFTKALQIAQREEINEHLTSGTFPWGRVRSEEWHFAVLSIESVQQKVTLYRWLPHLQFLQKSRTRRGQMSRKRCKDQREVKKLRYATHRYSLGGVK